MQEKPSYRCPVPVAGPVGPGCLDLAREVSLVALTVGVASFWAATGCRAVAGRGCDEEPPSRASDTSIASFTSPSGPAPPRLEAGAVSVGLELALSCILLSKDGRKV
jgi:hypothetical protein